MRNFVGYHNGALHLGDLPLTPDTMIDAHWVNQGQCVEPWGYDMTVQQFAAAQAGDGDDCYLITDHATGLLYEVWA